ncbi:MAG TPA: putative metal-binding motif-containing protein, partial [Myxococcota bacterium]|nr:putative metal-binding motif-containing protein [Myxococcota bacterium]
MNARAAALAVTLAACAPRPVPDPPCGVWTLDLATADRDGDGYAWCGELSEVDCDDGDADVHPGAPERCDGVDSDCDGALPAWEADVDADGRPVCLGDCDDADGLDAARDRDGDGWTRCMGDCDDADAQVHPAAPEVCDGVDSDCDGRMDTDELDG